VLVVAWVVGMGPAVLTCILSMLAIDYFYVPPIGALKPLGTHQIVRALIFLGVGLTMAWLAATRRRTQVIAGAAQTKTAQAERMMEQVHRVVSGPFLEAGASADTLMRDLLTRIRESLGSDTATILMLTDDGRHLVPTSSDGLREAVPEADLRIPLGEGVAGRIATSETGMIFPDLSDIEVFSLFVRDRVKSIVGAPLKADDRLIGVIHVGSSTPHHFTADDLTLLRLVADRVALVIERARLFDAERAAREEAEAANRMKDEFLAMLSHELRSPLNAILGWAHGFKRHWDPEVRRAVEVIERNARVMTKLVNDLLDVSRIVADRLPIERQPVETPALVDAVLEAMRPTAEEKGVVIQRAVDPAVGAVWGDPARLHQALANLVANAVKFTPTGGTVQVRVHRDESHVQLTVADTGQGIAPDFLPHVFERFRQEDTSTTRRQGGLGLGLAIVRHVVEAHGGSVQAESSGPGCGACFTIRIPLLKPVLSGKGGAGG
jgi:signal transduction histidine kinase